MNILSEMLYGNINDQQNSSVTNKLTIEYAHYVYVCMWLMLYDIMKKEKKEKKKKQKMENAQFIKNHETQCCSS